MVSICLCRRRPPEPLSALRLPAFRKASTFASFCWITISMRICESRQMHPLAVGMKGILLHFAYCKAKEFLKHTGLEQAEGSHNS